MRRLSHTVATVTSVAFLTLTTGCGGDNPAPSAAPSDSESGAKTTSAASPEAVPSAPSSSTENTRQGAASFVEFYIDTLNYGSRTGDLGPARRLTLQGCRSCTRITESIESVYANDGKVEGGLWTPTPRSARKTNGGFVIDVEIDFAPQSITRSEGQAPEIYEGGRGTASFSVVRRGEDWKIQQWSRA